MSHNELVNGIFLRPRSSWNIFFQRYLWTPVKNVTFLVLRNTFWLFENFFQILTQKCFSTKLRSWWFLIGYNRVPAISLSKKPFCLIFRIPTLRLLSSHWSTGLWSLIGPFDDNRSHDVRTFQYSPLLTRQSRLISDYYLLLLFTIYLHFLLFRRLRRKYKIQRFCVVANLFSGTERNF